MEPIDIENILIFHKKIINKTGGSDGVRDLGLIESALSRGFMTFDGRELYEDIVSQVNLYTVQNMKN